MPGAGPDHLVVLLDSSVVRAEQHGFYREGDRVLKDELADLEDMFTPIQRGLVRLMAYNAGVVPKG